MIWRFIWNTSEALHINLRRIGPYVFGKMIGATEWKRVDE